VLARSPRRRSTERGPHGNNRATRAD